MYPFLSCAKLPKRRGSPFIPGELQKLSFPFSNLIKREANTAWNTLSLGWKSIIKSLPSRSHAWMLTFCKHSRRIVQFYHVFCAITFCNAPTNFHLLKSDNNYFDFILCFCPKVPSQISQKLDTIQVRDFVIVFFGTCKRWPKWIEWKDEICCLALDAQSSYSF